MLQDRLNKMNNAWNNLTKEQVDRLTNNSCNQLLFEDNITIEIVDIESFLKYFDEVKVCLQENRNNKQIQNKGNIEEPILWLTYKELILKLNDKKIICKCNCGSGNHNILEFLINNPNKTWTRAELKERNILRTNTVQNSSDYTKSFYTFLVNIKLYGKNGHEKIGKLFFNEGLSKNSICLRNPIYKKDIFNADFHLEDINLNN